MFIFKKWKVGREEGQEVIIKNIGFSFANQLCRSSYSVCTYEVHEEIEKGRFV